MTRRDDLVDECRPVVGPFLLEDGDKCEVELVDESALLLERFFLLRRFEYLAYDEVADALTLLPG